jgi:hypothetical protein
MSNRIRATLAAACIFACCVAAGAQEQRPKLPIPSAKGEKPKTPSPELVGNLTKELSITPEQAAGGAGALFGLAKNKLKPEEFLKVADVVPGMDGFLNAAPKSKKAGGAADMLGTVGSMLPGKAGTVASLAGTFQQLGLSPEQAVKFVPIMTKFVQLKGGSGVAKLLTGALK